MQYMLSFLYELPLGNRLAETKIYKQKKETDTS